MSDNFKEKIINPGKWYTVFDENGNIVEAKYDESYRKMLGYELEEEYLNAQESWTSKIHPDDQDRLNAVLADCMAKHPEGKDFDIEYRMMTKWGYRWFHDYGHCVRREDGLPIRCDGAVFDIQKVKDYEEQQRHDALKKEVLDYIVNHDEDPIELLSQFAEKIRVLIDCDQVIYRDLEKTRIMVNSPAIEKTWSVPESYCLQCQHLDPHHPMYAGGFTKMDNCQEGWQGIPVFHKCPIKSSLTRIVYCNGEIAGYLAIHYVQNYHHFTELEEKTLEEFCDNLSLILSRYEAKKATSKLESMQRMMKMIFSLSDEFDPIMVLNPETGEYDWFMSLSDDVVTNTSMSAHGSDFYHDIGIDIASIIHKDDRAQFKAFYSRENMMKIAETGESQETENRWFIQTENAYKWKYNKVVRMIDEGGVTHIVIGVVDTTERKAKEKEQEEQKEQLQKNIGIINALTENNQRVMALEDNLESLYDVELESGKYIGYVKGDFYQSNVADKLLPPGDYFEDLRGNIDAVIYPEDRDVLFHVLERESIRKALSETDRVEHFYRLYVGDTLLWFKIRIVYKDSARKSIIIGCFNAEKEVSERQRENQQRTALINKMAGDDGVFIVDCVNNTRASIHDRVGGLSNFGSESNYYETICKYINVYTIEADREKMMKETDPANILERIKSENEYSVRFMDTLSGRPRYSLMQIVKLSDTEVLQSFKDCDDEVVAKYVNNILMSEYAAIYLVNLDKNEIRPTRSSTVSAVGAFNKTLAYDKKVLEFAETVAPQYRQDWINFSDVNFMKRYLAEESHREFVYELPGTEKPVRRFSMDVLERNGGDASVVLFSFVGIDDISAKAILLQKEVSEQSTFMNFFLNTYVSAYYVDLERLSCKIYKRTEQLEEDYPIITNYFDSVKEYVNRDVHPDDRKEFMNIVSPDKMREILKKQPEFTHVFRDISGGKEKIYRMQVIRGGAENHAAFGFKDVTEEVRQEQQRRQELEKAQSAFRKGDGFKVYIIDWLMPDMNGIETTRRIRKVIGDDAPIIILTAYDWSDIEEEAREAGVTGFVSKPMFPSDLHRILNKCLGQEEQTDSKSKENFDINGKKILLVEDNALNREIASAILGEFGCVITTAEDGDIAVEKVKAAKAGDFDIILMDIQMPTIDGYEATRQIRALGTEISKIPILAMTANAFEEDRKAALEAGMNEHIAKPIDIDNLKETLSKFL